MAQAGNDDSNDIIKKVEKSFINTKAMSASFTQKIESKGFDAVQTFTGRMTMLKPAMMKWEYDNPKGRIMVVDGKKLWFYDPKENVARYENLKGYLNPNSPALFLAGEATLGELFDIVLVKPSKKGKLEVVRLKLTPKEPQPGLKAMLLTLNNKSLEMVELLMVDYLGNRNRIIFDDVDRSARPAPEFFRFTPPAGVPVRSGTNPALR
ncbi:hypothetical protein MNBD_NITROSPINAE01-967 [hydrothermal vent metagenome]|uniref:Outer-membrane lipoprotein carrier protein n=1 Tax=hydrothermal vent metagenome TaxID=652676 RepID=A0A3B1BHP6_9ZZZZ